MNDGGEGCVLRQAHIEERYTGDKREQGGDQEACRYEAENAGKKSVYQRVFFFGIDHCHAATNSEEQNEDNKAAKLDDGDELIIEYQPERGPDWLKLKRESLKQTPNALYSDNGNIGSQNHLYRLVFANNKRVRYHDGKEHDDEEVPAEGHEHGANRTGVEGFVLVLELVRSF